MDNVVAVRGIGGLQTTERLLTGGLTHQEFYLAEVARQFVGSIGINCQVLRKRLDRNVPIQSSIARKVRRAHPAAAEVAGDLGQANVIDHRRT